MGGGCSTTLVPLILCIFLLSAWCQPEDFVRVRDSFELAAALRNASLYSQNQTTSTTVLLQLHDWGATNVTQSSDYFTLDRKDWAVLGPVYIWPGQRVRLTAPGPQLTLDFAGMTAVIAQKQGSFLEIDGMIMRGFASRHILNRDVPLNYIIPNFGAWPSIVAEPGAQMKFTNVTTFFLDDDCSTWARDPRASPINLYLDNGGTLQSNVIAVLDGGVHGIDLPVNNAQGAQVGSVSLQYMDCRAICVQDPSSRAFEMLPSPTRAAPRPATATASAAASGGNSGRRRLWWVWLVVGLGALALGLLVGLGVLMLVLRRRRRQKEEEEKNAPLELAAMQGAKIASLESRSSLDGKVMDGVSLPEHWRKRWLGPLQGEQVEIGPLLGRGGYGKVYKGRWKSAMVAVKIVEHSHFPKDHPDRSPQSDPTSSDAKIAREMLLSTSISHPNIIATYKICTIRVGNVPDSGSLDSHEGSAEELRRRLSTGVKVEPSSVASSCNSAREAGSLLETWILMELADRGSLSDALRGGRFPTHDFTAIYRCLLDIASGVEYLHDSGLIHGDLKSANVLLKSTGTDARGFVCKLADFGLSRVLDHEKHTHISTQTYGTVAYMPPELLSDSRLTRSADIYSFGMLMWELISGEVPFDRMTVGQIFFAVVQEQQRPPIPEKGVPAPYLKLMQRCWNTDPKQRPEVPEVLAALKQQYKHHRATNISKSLSSPPESKRC
ncbi:kinase-like protein [Coccomyxa subellipsoidea C-169]|uniref:Kinase-like protein n=1 Tax=Coccomyxa subellipsoidea (strain C-169) TaxID=574566 RepID=I0YWA5_COCSC|nr:kinase-like protein [Coccomyxa subellipsoidea C-169]EIE22674.1 kinase-like protein [Coccomyxa subellipsoidea C-169]|eukprot:XP_005647218.1 kinase-like protein [Coccomyxa subellipsoidea C-169]